MTAAVTTVNRRKEDITKWSASRMCRKWEDGGRILTGHGRTAAYGETKEGCNMLQHRRQGNGDKTIYR